MSAIITFIAKSPTYMALLMQDFRFDELDAAAIMGNLGHESGGLTKFQEINPTVPGSRGGYGWAQWTGPRRLAFEAYCRRNGLDPKSDKANYGFLFVELKGTEKAAVAKTKAAVGLEAKVKAFELAYERAGHKAYASRLKWAQRALDAWNAAGTVADIPSVVVVPEPVVQDLVLADLVDQIKLRTGSAKVSLVLEYD